MTKQQVHMHILDRVLKDHPHKEVLVYKPYFGSAITKNDFSFNRPFWRNMSNTQAVASLKRRVNSILQRVTTEVCVLAARSGRRAICLP
jgi:hypothetical protein